MNSQIEPEQINDQGHLTIGGVDSLELAAEYQTPLVVYDVAAIRHQIRAFKKVFAKNQVAAEVSYASKAFSAIAIYQVVAQEDGHIDVVSGGELTTAIKAQFPMEKVSFHGNNKSKEELELAVQNGVGMIIIDNFHEIDLLGEVLDEQDATATVSLRITPGIAAHTNEYIQTGQVDSKFGFDLESGQADRALEEVLANPRLKVVGLHAHIGSQIFEVVGFKGVAKKLVDVAEHWHEEFGFQTRVLNVGGGFGIRYVQEDQPLPPEDFVDAIIKAVKKEVAKKGLLMPAIWIEPGRSIVGPAGYSLYTVGSRKDLLGYQPFVTVDGGMGDNIRPALYQAAYETVYAKDPRQKPEETVRIAGKYCESGDILARDQALPKTKPGDLLVMLDTGAYGYAMASNYNRNPRPAVVFVENGHAQLVIQRESWADTCRLDLPLASEDK